MFRRIATTGVVAVLVLGLTAAPTPAAPPTVGSQFAWLLDASSRAPVPATELQSHLDATLLAAIGGADGFNQVLQQIGPLTAGPLTAQSATELRRVVSSRSGDLLAKLDVDAAGLLAGILITPYLTAPTSWAQLDASLRTLAPRVSFAAARISPSGCSLVHGVDPATARPLGSAFKLYVLGALAREVREGRLSWDTKLALNPAWKSLPSGVLQDQPDGTVYPLAQYADYMISISDNTAADHLLHEVGREQVRRQFALFGNTAPNAPVLTTRELFVLKGWHYPATAKAYAALPAKLRSLTLPALDRVPLTAIRIWQQPEMIDQLEWSGSPMDMCRALAGLWDQHDPQVNDALTINDGGLGLPAAQFPTVWFKGGSEPGVFTLNYLARTAGGSLVTASLMLSDPRHPLDETAVAGPALALLRGALQLASGQVT
jgi:beta-lactamase class A